MIFNFFIKRKNIGFLDRKFLKKFKIDNFFFSLLLNFKLWCYVYLKKLLSGLLFKVKNLKNFKFFEEYLEEMMKMMLFNKLYINFYIFKKGLFVKKLGKYSDKFLKVKGRSKGILNGQKFIGNFKFFKKGLKIFKIKMKQMILLDMVKGMQKMI